MVALLLSLLPNAIYLLVLRGLDSFALARFKLIMRNMLFGMIWCALAFVLTNKSCIEIPVSICGLSLMPFIEEVMKGCILARLTIRGKFRFMSQCLIYGAAIGSGFSLLENLLYFYLNPSMVVGTGIVRGFDCAIMHMGCTALFVTFLLLLRHRFGVFLSLLISIVPSSIIHFLYNLVMENSLISFTLALVLVVLIFIILFVLLFAIGERKIRKWMDCSINNDIIMLSAIRSGNFPTTETGKYLMDLKEQFQSDVFSDMLSYFRLFLELKISKQSEMLLRQAGFSSAESGDRHSERNMMKAQMKILSDRIGKTGMNVLSPLINDNI